ncbi:MAG: NifB/NifX family molybdenum-iron cluster-binding protein [Spirochaetaceae bacterium]|nr:NifB/NifX family molybdenum-iron cluster-binding protein [Spirochaetaceae bacterium]
MDLKEMTIAFPSNDGETVEEHFGHCRQFVLINTRDGKEISRVSVDPPEHVPGSFPAFLAEQGANVIITGGMGGRAVSLFKEQNIEVILGAGGSISENLRVFLEGELESKGSECNHH